MSTRLRVHLPIQPHRAFPQLIRILISWQFPAGLVNPGMSSTNVTVRETFDETGIHCVVSRALGTRLHPTTRVICDYVLCDYVSGVAKNVDVVENVDVLWAEKAEITRFIPANHIYEPVLDVLQPPIHSAV